MLLRLLKTSLFITTQFYVIYSQQQQEYLQTPGKFLNGCVVSETFPGTSYLLLLVTLLVGLLFYMSHSRKTDHYENLIKTLKVENELLVLQAEYKTHKAMHEKIISELHSVNNDMLTEMTALKHTVNTKCREEHKKKKPSIIKAILEPYCGCSSNRSSNNTTSFSRMDNNFKNEFIEQTQRNIDSSHDSKNMEECYEDLSCEIKRKRFGALRRSLSTSSLPSEHDEADDTPTSSLPPDKYDSSLESMSGEVIEEIRMTSRENILIKKESSTQRSINHLRIPDITITDTIQLQNFDARQS